MKRAILIGVIGVVVVGAAVALRIGVAGEDYEEAAPTVQVSAANTGTTCSMMAEPVGGGEEAQLDMAGGCSMMGDAAGADNATADEQKRSMMGGKQCGGETDGGCGEGTGHCDAYKA